MKSILILFLFFSVNNCWSNLKIFYKKGAFEHLRGNQKIEDDKVLTGDVMKLEGGTVVIIKGPNETLKLTDDCTIKVEQYNQEQSLYNLIKGEVIARINHKKFNIKTKVASMGVRGTEFYTNHQKDKTWMCVNKGVVSVSDESGNISDVGQGQGVPVIGKKMGQVKSYEWTKNINWDVENTELSTSENTKKELNYIGPLERSYD